MRIFIIGGTGQVGSLVASGLVANGADVRVLTRDQVKAAALPAGQTGVVGDMLDVKVLRQEMAEVDGVFIMHPPVDYMSFAGLTAIAIAKECMTANVVMMTGQDLEMHGAVGHIGSLIPSELALARSGLNYTLLNPNYFFQNDERQRDQIMLNGTYASPVGDVGLSRCDTRDIADAAVVALGRPGNGERYRICGPEVLTGERIAAIWADALDRPVRYGGHDDMAQFERRLVEIGTAPHWAFDLREMYESFQRHGLKARPEDIDSLAALIGHSPRTMSNYASETARRWLSEPQSAEAVQW